MDGDALGPKESQRLAGVSCLTGALINFFLPSEKRNTLLLQNHVHIRETCSAERKGKMTGDAATQTSGVNLEAWCERGEMQIKILENSLRSSLGPWVTSAYLVINN